MNNTEKYPVSSHRLTTWIQCPRKLYFYLENYPRKPVERKYIDTGLAVHDLLEDRVKGITGVDPLDYATKHNVPDEMMDVFDKCVENSTQFDKYIGVGIPEKTIYKDFVTPKGRQIRLQARIDLIADNAIWDYKTGKKVDKDEYRLQGQVYHFATSNYYPVAKFISLQTNDVLEVSPPPEDYIPKLCDKYVDEIEKGVYPQKQSRLCEWCEYYNYCFGKAQFAFIDDIRANPEEYGMVREDADM